MWLDKKSKISSKEDIFPSLAKGTLCKIMQESFLLNQVMFLVFHLLHKIHLQIYLHTNILMICTYNMFFVSLCLKRELIICLVEISHLVSEKYWFRRRIAYWLFLHIFYDKIISFKE